MRYQGSAAIRLDMPETTEARREHRRSFEVVEGGGLDARARRGVSERFLAKLRAFVACVAIVVIIGCARVAITAMTVSNLTENQKLEDSIESAESLNDDLQLEHSSLSSASRIERIATQNLGMVRATDVDSSTSAASASTASSAETQASTDTASADAAQLASVNVSSPSLS